MRYSIDSIMYRGFAKTSKRLEQHRILRILWSVILPVFGCFLVFAGTVMMVAFLLALIINALPLNPTAKFYSVVALLVVIFCNMIYMVKIFVCYLKVRKIHIDAIMIFLGSATALLWCIQLILRRDNIVN